MKNNIKVLIIAIVYPLVILMLIYVAFVILYLSTNPFEWNYAGGVLFGFAALICLVLSIIIYNALKD